MDKLVLSPEKARAERDRAVLPNVTIVMPGSSPVAPVGELPGQLAASALTPRPCALAPGAPPGRTGESTALPPITAQVANLFRAAVAFVGDGCAICLEIPSVQQRRFVCFRLATPPAIPLLQQRTRLDRLALIGQWKGKGNARYP
jgi:hypothetical protein